jgi:hypothetical protein
MPDITRPNKKMIYAVNEINHAPGQEMHFSADGALSNQCAERTLVEYFSL